MNGREALQQVVEQIRGEHRACRHSTTVCNLGGCPWPWMFEEDVTALYEGLVAAGYSIQSRVERWPDGSEGSQREL